MIVTKTTRNTRGKQKGKRRANEGQPLNNGKNGQKEKDTPSKRKKTVYDDEPAFVSFWNNYPRKVSKKDAFKAWLKVEDEPAVVMDGLEASKRAWIKEERPEDKIPHAATWLNGERWTDNFNGDIQHGEPKSKLIETEDTYQRDPNRDNRGPQLRRLG